MVKLKGLPSADIIKSLAGVVDFYESNGQIIARGWPRKSQPGPGTGSWTTAALFARVIAKVQQANQPLREIIRAQGTSPETTINDYAVSLYFGHGMKNMYTKNDGSREPINNPPNTAKPSTIPSDDPDQVFIFLDGVCVIPLSILVGDAIMIYTGSNRVWTAQLHTRPPTFHRRFKTVRGTTRPCGFELSWWYPEVRPAIFFNNPGGSVQVNTPDAQELIGASYTRWIQLVPVHQLERPQPISLIPPIGYWHPPILTDPTPNRQVAKLLLTTPSNALDQIDGNYDPVKGPPGQISGEGFCL